MRYRLVLSGLVLATGSAACGSSDTTEPQSSGDDSWGEVVTVNRSIVAAGLEFTVHSFQDPSPAIEGLPAEPDEGIAAKYGGWYVTVDLSIHNPLDHVVAFKIWLKIVGGTQSGVELLALSTQGAPGETCPPDATSPPPMCLPPGATERGPVVFGVPSSSDSYEIRFFDPESGGTEGFLLK